MKEEVQHESKTNGDNILLNKLVESNQTAKILYKLQIRKPSTLTKAEKKWQHLINEELNWKRTYMKPLEVTSDTYKLRSFLYKFITRIISTNVFLYKYKIKPSNICDFCSSYLETLQHLFWECQFV